MLYNNYNYNHWTTDKLSEAGNQSLQVLKRLWRTNPDLFREIFKSNKAYGEPVSERIFDRYVDSVEPLIKAGLVYDYQHRINREAVCQINTIHRSEVDSPLFICTDFPEEDEKRVFPYDDEAKEWLNLYNSSGRIAEPSTIVDLCCGAGSIGLWLAKYYSSSFVYGFDNNQKALSYARYNAALNHIQNFEGWEWDALKAIEEHPINLQQRWSMLEEKVDLICADPPFAMAPLGN